MCLSVRALQLIDFSRHELLVSTAKALEINTEFRLGKGQGATLLAQNSVFAVAGLGFAPLIIFAAAQRAGIWRADRKWHFDQMPDT